MQVQQFILSILAARELSNSDKAMALVQQCSHALRYDTMYDSGMVSCEGSDNEPRNGDSWRRISGTGYIAEISLDRVAQAMWS